MPDARRSLVDVLRRHVEARPHAVAYTFLDQDGAPAEELTYAELDAAARALAAALQEAGDVRGERVLVVEPTGPDFVCAFFGALYAGAAAMPIVPSRSPRVLAALGAMLRNARPRFGVVAEPLQRELSASGALAAELGAMRFFTARAGDRAPDRWRPPALDRDSLALLQYTSGSTGTPRGVRVSHGNLLHNEQAMSDAFCTTQESVIVSWLPLFHDMGLIGNMLQSAWLGGRCVLLAPATFLQRPFRWLEAISRYRADFSGAPNFAYDLCAHKITDDERRELDLSCWRVAFNGAEPVRDETLARFARRFAEAGFAPRSFYPCYGLAEATLFVSGGGCAEAPRRFSASAAELSQHRARPRAGDEPGTTLVSCGHAWGDQRILVVDPETGRPLPEGDVGEIWIAGASVAGGYFEQPEATAETFGARLPDGAGPFLRTGDLAFFDEGELFIAGRLKDLVIVRGRNHHPHDIERTVERCDPALRPGCGACFAVEHDGEEQLVVVQEVRSPDVDGAAIAAAIRRAVFEQHEVHALRIALVGAGSVPKTSSGKLQRRACRARLLAGDLPLVHDSVLPARIDAPEPTGPAPALERLRRLVAGALRLPPEAIGEDRPLVEIGLDSLSAAALRARLRLEMGGHDVAFDELLSTATLRTLAAAAGAGAAPGCALPNAPDAPDCPARGISATQRRLWLLEQLAPGSHHVPFGVEIDGPLDGARLRAALERLLDRHEALRTSFRQVGGDVEARVAERASIDLPAEDLRGLDLSGRVRRVRELSLGDAARPFDLTRAPLMRARLLRVDEARHLLVLVLHHAIADGWSAGVIARDLPRLYERPDEAAPRARPLGAEIARAAAERDPERTARARAFWRAELAGAAWSIDLPRRRSRRPGQGGRALRVAQAAPASTKRAIDDLARREGVTPFVVVLAAFQGLLQLYSGQTDLCIGTIVAERASPASQDVVGPLINTVVLRVDGSGDPTFRELLRRARGVAARALEHADLPFDEAVQAAGSDARGPSPFQVMVVSEGFPLAPVEGRGLRWLPRDLDVPLVPFDLTLAVRPAGDELSIALDADASLFDEPAVRGMLDHYRRALDAALSAPERRLSLLSPWTDDDYGSRSEPCATAAAEGAAPVHRRFAEARRRAPDAPALLGDEVWSYERLGAASDAIARLVRARGCGPERLVGIHVDDPALRLAAVLGVLEAGAAYLPLDVALPPARLGWIAGDARPALVLTRAEIDWAPRERVATITAAALAGAPGAGAAPADVAPEQLAYVTYTSGSTGEPLGVAVPHGALAQHCSAMARAYDLRASDRVLQFASLGFDVSAEEVFPTWSRGAAVVTIDERTPGALRRAAARHGVTVLNLPSRYWELWAAETGGDLPSLRLLVVGSEPVSAAALASFRERFSRVECLHAYGLTEATITSTLHRVDGESCGDLVPIGRALPGTTLYVLDGAMRRVGRGGRGELYVGGAALGRGYLGRAAATAERFVPSPFGAPGERLFRTGDIVRHRWDGELEHIGRRDGQLKVRGHRIAPEEVEQGLRRAGAKEAAVVALGERLVAHVELGDRPLSALRRAAAEHLPRYMVPAAWIEVEAWPRGASGKIDRRRLPAPGARDEAGAAPRGAVEAALAGIFGDVLGIDGVKRETSFFDAGGHSLLAMQVVERIGRALAVELPVRAVFEAPTVWELAERVEAARGTGGRDVSADMTRRSRAASVPLTAAQRRLWFLEMLHGRTAQYNMPLGVVVRGPLDEERLRWAFDRLIERHEALRTVVSGGAAHPGPTARLGVEEVGGMADAERRANELAQEAFDVERGPLVRARLLRAGATERLIVLVVHHLVCDGRSLQIMLEDLGELYRTGAPKAPPPFQYGDYALHEEERTRRGEGEGGVRFWKRQLEGSEPVWLPYDGSASTGVAGRIQGRLPVTTGELEALGRRAGVTLHMVLLGLVQVLLHRYGGDEDVRVAIPVANRQGGDLEGIVGCFVNTIIMRTPVRSDDPFLGHLGRVKRTALDAYEHQGTPFDELVAAVQPGRGAGTPLIEVMLLVERDGLRADLGPGLETEVEELENAGAKFDLTITIRLRGREVDADIEYDRGRFERETVDGFLESLQELAKSIVRDPDEPSGALRILSDPAEDQVVAWERGGPLRGGRPLHEYVEAQAARTPDAIAVESGARTLTYRELDERANQVARGLARRGVGRESLVGLRMRRTEELVIAMLGVLKAGATYVPIDPDYPPERQRIIEADSGVKHTLRGIGELRREDRSAPAARVEPGRLAYVIYTSGSEGRPKGVGITHAGASALLEWVQATYSKEELARVLASTSVCFDLSVFEIYGPLSVGGTVVLVDSVLEVGDAERLTLVNSVPSAVAQVLDRLPRSVRTVNLAGEVLPRSLVDALYERGVESVWNLYGPTEDTTYSTAARIPRGERRAPGIGAPLPGTTAHVVDARMARVAKGARGELVLGGAGLGRGYIHQPAKTAERFVPDPHGQAGERLYRTGDWVRRRSDGTLEYLGRRDGQVKVRGYRIETGEVEEALRRAGAREAAVVARGDRLVAYVEVKDRRLDEIHRIVAEDLPRYMVPTSWAEIAAWPRTPSGKIDRKHLPEPDAPAEAGTEPAPGTEARIAAIFGEVLGTSNVKRETSFFDAGGHSLLAVQVAERIGRAFGVDLPLREIFGAPTVAELAQRVEAAGGRVTEDPAPRMTRRAGSGDAPLTSAQRRLWFLHQLAPGSSHYHVPIAVEITGPLDVAALGAAFEAIVRRHEGLRTTFPSVDGVPAQRIAPSIELPLAVVDLPEGAVDDHIAREVERPFALDERPPFRISLLRARPGEATLLLVMHHIVCDEWSVGVLLREFSALYAAQRAGRPPPLLPPLPLHMTDWAEWEASPAAQTKWEAHRAYWASQLRGAAPVRLPGAPAAAGSLPPRGRHHAFSMERAVADGIRSLALEAQATSAMVLLAAFDALLHRATGDEDIAVGTPIANRRRETEPLIGFFVNQLVMRVDLRGRPTFIELVRRVREVALGAHTHGELPFDEIVAVARTKQARPLMPLVNVQLDVHNAPFGALTVHDLKLTPRPIARSTVQFDLQLSVEEADDGLFCFLGYDAARLDDAWAHRFAGDFAALLRAAVADPGQTLDELPGGAAGAPPWRDPDEDFSF